jgi:GNAT superfamily N-acetyltransferase
VTAILRQAERTDIPGIWEVRYSVTENTLSADQISDEDVRREIEDTGRGWVVEDERKIQAFAICNAETGNIWALFVHPRAQGSGFGSRLHDQMLAWLRTKDVPVLWLTTGENTRAREFYEHRGWTYVGMSEPGEARYEIKNAAK